MSPEFSKPGTALVQDGRFVRCLQQPSPACQSETYESSFSINTGSWGKLSSDRSRALHGSSASSPSVFRPFDRQPRWHRQAAALPRAPEATRDSAVLHVDLILHRKVEFGNQGRNLAAEDLARSYKPCRSTGFEPAA